METKAKFNPSEHMMNLKGKEYLQVMWRLVWFREEHADWMIRTQLVEHHHGEYAVFKAEVSDTPDHILATAYGSESIKDFRDYLEKAETKAIGRALAILGYGTQFAPELDEEERIVDSPVAQNKSQTKKEQVINNPTATDMQKVAKDVANKLGTPVDEVTVGKILYLARAKNILPTDLCGYYHVDELKKLTAEQGEDCIKRLNATKAKQ
jgi:hypothetical protein